MDLLEGKMIHQSPKPGPKTSRTRPRTPSHRWHAGHGRSGRGCACFRSLKGPKLTVKNRCPFWGSDFSHPFWDTPTQSEPLEADASWWTKSAWDQDPVCNLWHVVDMRSGINLFDLSSCFGNTLHCITSEKSVKAFAGCKWILELA